MKRKIIILMILFLQFSLDSSTQNIKRYYSDYSVTVNIDIDESPDGGSFEDILWANVSIIHDIFNSTIEIKLSDSDKRIYFFTSVKYDQTFTSNGNQYVAYTANEDGVPYFISFGKDLIKVDNRVKYKSIGFHLKN